MTDTTQIRTIVYNIKVELARIETALNKPAPDAAATIENAGDRIASMGDMIRDAL